jgi:hypothetical protein
MRIVGETPKLRYMLMRIIIPTEEAFVSRVWQSRIDQRIRVAAAGRIIVEVQEEIVGQVGSNLCSQHVDTPEEPRTL